MALDTIIAHLTGLHSHVLEPPQREDVVDVADASHCQPTDSEASNAEEPMTSQQMESLSLFLQRSEPGPSEAPQTPLTAQPSTFTECRLERDKRDAKTWQKIKFAEMVRKRRHILFGECDGATITAKAKEEGWREIQAELEQIGADTFKGKSWMRLRDHDWQYIRRHAMNRYEHGKPSCGRLNELDQIVVDIVQGDKGFNNNVAQQETTNSSLEAQLCHLLASVSQDQTQSQQGCQFLLQPKQEPDEALVERPTPPPPSSPLASSAHKRAADTLLRGANGTPGPVCETSRSPAPSGESAPKKLRYSPSCVESTHASLEQLQRQKLELELQHMRSEELRRQELHSLHLDKLRLELALLRRSSSSQ